MRAAGTIRLRNLGAWAVVLGVCATGAARAEEPSFDELVKLNASRIFGGDLSRDKDRFTLKFPGEGHFERGFSCTGKGRGGIESNIGELKSPAMRKLLIDGHKKGKPSLIGLQGGSAVSRFEIGDDFEVRFRLRIPNLDSRSKLQFFFNRQGRTEVIQSNFFQDLVVPKEKIRVRTKNTQILGAPAKWFDKGAEGMQVVATYKGGKFTVKLGLTDKKAEKPQEKLVEVVSTEVEKPTSGTLGFSFDRVSLMISDLTIQGKFPTKWVEKEIDRLRKAKKLRTKDKAAEVAKKGEAGESAKKSVKRRRRRGDKPDLKKPDPEADEDL